MIYGMKANKTIWPAWALPFQVSLELGRDLCVNVFIFYSKQLKCSYSHLI